MPTPTLLHRGSLMTYQVPGQDRETCLGYLFDFTGHGIFDPNFGTVNVTSEEADAHNKALSEAELKGLDESCQIGQCGTFYYVHGQVQTFVGVVVCPNPAVTKTQIVFTRNGKTFRGRRQKEADCFNFKRIQ